MGKSAQAATYPSNGLSSTNLLRPLLGLFSLVCLITAVNVNDSNLLKPIALYLGSAALAAYISVLVLNSTKREISYSIVHLFLFAYLLVGSLSLVRAYSADLGLQALGVQTCYILAFCVAFDASPPKKSTDGVTTTLLLLTALVCAVASIEVISPSFFSIIILTNERECISTFGNATYFSGFLVLVLPVVVAVFISSSQWSFKKLASALLLAAAIYFLIITEARSAWIAAIISLVVFAFLAYSRGKETRVLLLIVVITSVAVYFLFPDLFQRRLSNMFTKSPESTFTRRLFFYEGALRAFVSSPLIGNGIGNFAMFLPRFRSPDYWMFKSEDIVPHAHNEFLEVLSETGLLGFVLFVLIIAYSILSFIRFVRTSSGPNRIITIGFICGIIAVLVDNLGSLNLRTIPVEIGFWMFLGISLRQCCAKERTVTVRPPSFVKKLKYVPVLMFGLFLCWFVPHTKEEYLSDHRFFEGLQFSYHNENELAIGKFKEALAQVPENADVKFYLASTLMKSGKHTEAIAYASSLLRQFPYYPKIRLVRAISEFMSGDTNNALVDISEEMKMATEPLALFYASYFAFEMKRTSVEYGYLKALIENSISSSNTDYAAKAIDRFSLIAITLKDTMTCYSTLSRLRIAFPINGDILASVSEGFLRLGRFAEARETLNEAMALDQLDSTARAHLETIARQLSLRNKS